MTMTETTRTAPAWRKGARALAKRFGTGELRAARVGGEWWVTNMYALRMFGADTIEAQALTAFAADEGIVGVLHVKVWRSGKNDMKSAPAGWGGVSVDAMRSVVEGVRDRDATLADGCTDGPETAGGVPTVQAVAGGEVVATFAAAVLSAGCDDGDELWVPDGGLSPARVTAGGRMVGMVAPMRVR